MEIKRKIDNGIELRSEEFQEVLGKIPSWILRWGMVFLSGIFLLLLMGSAVFRYPDIIMATVQLTGRQPVATVVAKSSGKLQCLYVKDNSYVEKGEYLALVENEASTMDVIYLRNFLNKKVPWELNSLVLPKRKLILGQIQSLYSSYYTTLANYLQFKQTDYYQMKIKIMEQRIRKNEWYVENMKRQQALVEEQLKIGKRKYQRDSLLHAQKLMADVDLEETYSQYLQNLLSYENIRSGMQKQKLQMILLRETLYDAEHEYITRRDELELQLKSFTMQLQTEIRKWEMTYVLKSPVDGKVTFTRFWSENQNITAGEEAFSVVPDDKGKIFAKSLLPMERSGKVRVGQKVIIRFSNYPDTEFGVINGIVQNISLVSVKVKGASNYVVEIALTDGLRTTYGRNLPFVSEMEGQADIITDDLSLLERFLLPVKKIFMENI